MSLHNLFRWPVVITVILVSLTIPCRIAGAEPASKSWHNTTELSIVGTGGNSNASTYSLKNSYQVDWPGMGLELHLTALNANSNGTVTAEQYSALEKVSWNFADGHYVYERGGWDANAMSGINGRFNIFFGYGRGLMKKAEETLFAEAGAGWVSEQLTNGTAPSFISGRLFAKYTRALSAHAAFSQDAEFLQNFSDGTDYRLNFYTSVSAALMDNLALKGSFSWKRVNKPAAGFGKIDTQTSMALVLNY